MRSPYALLRTASSGASLVAFAPKVRDELLRINRLSFFRLRDWFAAQTERYLRVLPRSSTPASTLLRHVRPQEI